MWADGRTDGRAHGRLAMLKLFTPNPYVNRVPLQPRSKYCGEDTFSIPVRANTAAARRVHWYWCSARTLRIACTCIGLACLVYSLYLYVYPNMSMSRQMTFMDVNVAVMPNGSGSGSGSSATGRYLRRGKQRAQLRVVRARQEEKERVWNTRLLAVATTVASKRGINGRLLEWRRVVR